MSGNRKPMMLRIRRPLQGGYDEQRVPLSDFLVVEIDKLRRKVAKVLTEQRIAEARVRASEEADEVVSEALAEVIDEQRYRLDNNRRARAVRTAAVDSVERDTRDIDDDAPDDEVARRRFNDADPRKQ